MRKLEKFEKAVKNLSEIYRYEEPYDIVTQTGMVSLYEIAFEQAWKAMKEVLENAGFGEKIGSPRAIIKLAYREGMIDDEELWLSALLARNNVAHSYSDAVAKGIIRDSKEKYIALFQKLQKEMRENWV